MFGDVKKWQKDLERLSEQFDTEDEEGLHYILQGEGERGYVPERSQETRNRRPTQKCSASSTGGGGGIPERSPGCAGRHRKLLAKGRGWEPVDYVACEWTLRSFPVSRGPSISSLGLISPGRHGDQAAPQHGVHLVRGHGRQGVRQPGRVRAEVQPGGGGRERSSFAGVCVYPVGGQMGGGRRRVRIMMLC